MRTWLVTSAVVLCAAAVPSAQEPALAIEPAASRGTDGAQATADAVQAMLRADYTRAAELLEPLVANWQFADPAAAFFLGLLYENGLGVPQDTSRACALFSRGTDGQGPFTHTAEELTRAHLSTAPDCQLLMNRGLRQGFAPARFTLAADHWVSIDLSPTKGHVVATVSHGGREKEASFTFGPAMGAIYLPTVYTSLPGATDAAPNRHFIEVAHWLPVSPSRWDLQWSLAEVVGDEVVEVATKGLTSIESGIPPFDLSVELRDLVSVQRTEAGAVEIVLPNGGDSAREGVPTAAERKEVTEAAERRKAADGKVNWKRRRDPHRPPSFAYGDADGCSDLFVFGWSAGRAEAIAVRADRQVLELNDAPRTFDLAVPQAAIEVVAGVYERAQRQWKFCADGGAGDASQESWRAVGGTVTIQLSPQGVRAGNPQQYRATVQIDNAEFVNGAGQVVRAPQPIRLTAIAGPTGSEPAAAEATPAETTDAQAPSIEATSAEVAPATP